MARVSDHQQPLDSRSIFHFWKPLAATWLMMSVEGPTLTAVIARLPNAKLNLAAFGIAFAFALIVEAPVIMMMSASTALVQDRSTYLKLRNFAQSLNAAITAIMLIGVIPAIHHLIARTILGLSPELAHMTWLPLLLLLPWPGMIGIRRFYHGVLIRHGMTKRVAIGTVVRLVSMLGSTIFFSIWTSLPGAAVGAAALSTGVSAEAAMSYLLTRKIVRDLLSGCQTEDLSDTTGLSYAAIGRFYTPLALTAFLGLGIQPIVTFFLAYSRSALESLAVLPVINALIFIFRAPGLAFQEVAIALLGHDLKGYDPLRRFAVIMGSAVVLMIGIIAWTPLSTLWYSHVSGLSSELTAFAVPPTRILAIMPALTLLIAFQRALLVHSKTTRPVTWASLLEVSCVVVILTVCIFLMDLTGVIAAAVALLFGRLSANTALGFSISRISRKRSITSAL